VLLAATLGVAVFAVPAFALAWSGSALGFALSGLVMGALVGSLAVSAFVTELFPAEIRVTGTAVSYGFATALVGGTAPLVATVLTERHAAWVVPAYVAVVAVLGLLAALRSGETAFRELGQPARPA
jgi:MHS family proline/betaine transporter-like MFS transporter